MILGDLLRQVGHQPLRTFVWTERLIVTLNAVLPETQRVDGSTTGFALLGALYLLPDDERLHLLKSDVNPLDGTLIYVEVEHTANASPTVQSEKSAESFHRQILRDLASDGRRTFLVIAAVVIVIISIVIVTLTTSVYTQHGKKVSIFMRLVQAILDLLDALTGNYQPNNDYVPQ